MSPVELRAAWRSDVGMQRQRNEDSCFAGAHVFAVADGLGGHRAGEVASNLALDPIKDLDELPVRKAAGQVADALRRANRSVFDRQQSDEELKGMGTTMTAVVVDDDMNAHIAHVGDSRCYLIRAGEIVQLSRDHTLVARMVEEGKLTPDEAEVHPQRSILTRALGSERDVDVDEITIALAPEDRLLLCSDGLTGVLSDDEILRIAVRPEALDPLCGRLIDEANARGGPDNVTVVLVEISGGGGGGAHGLPMPRFFQRKSQRRRKRKIPIRPFVWLALALLLTIGGYIAVRTLTNRSYYVGVAGDQVAIFRGIPLSIGGIKFSDVIEPSTVHITDVAPYFRPRLREGVTVPSVQAGRDYIAHDLPRATPTPTPTPKRKRSPSPKARRS